MGRVEPVETLKFDSSGATMDAGSRRTKVNEMLCTFHTWYRKLLHEREAKSIEQKGLDLQAPKNF